MTETDNNDSDIAPPMSESEEIKPDLSPSLGEKFLGRFFKEPKEIEVRTWITTSNVETAVNKKKVKLGSLTADLGGKKYAIDYDAVQNIFGKLVYNTRHNDTTGALRYTAPKIARDAKNAIDLIRREHITALWGAWKMPFIIMIILGAITMIALVVVFILLGENRGLEAEKQVFRDQLLFYNSTGVIRFDG